MTRARWMVAGTGLVTAALAVTVVTTAADVTCIALPPEVEPSVYRVAGVRARTYNRAVCSYAAVLCECAADVKAAPGSSSAKGQRSRPRGGTP